MRKVRIATASFLMEDTPHTVEMNLERARGYIAGASAQHAHVICLPETVTTNGLTDPRAAIPQSDQWMEFFSRAASDHGIAVIAPFYTRIDGETYNQATVFNKTGDQLGAYRKVQPTGYEATYLGLGDAFPVIDLGFARVSIMICMDIYFAEIARIYAMKGAEILFWPTVSHGPTQSGLEAQIRTRAMDNSLYIVESNLAGHPPYA